MMVTYTHTDFQVIPILVYSVGVMICWSFNIYSGNITTNLL